MAMSGLPEVLKRVLGATWQRYVVRTARGLIRHHKIQRP